MVVPPLNNYLLNVKRLECFQIFAGRGNGVVNIFFCIYVLTCLELIAYFMNSASICHIAFKEIHIKLQSLSNIKYLTRLNTIIFLKCLPLWMA